MDRGKGGGVGLIHVTSDGKAAGFTVVKLSDIINVIIPHFKQYPLQSCKKLIFSYGHNVWKSWLIKNI